MAPGKKEMPGVDGKGPFETVPPEVSRLERKDSGVRPVAEKVAKLQSDTRELITGAEVGRFDWDDDEELTPVESPYGKGERDKKKHLMAEVGEMNLNGKVVSSQDLEVWIEIQQGIFTNVSQLIELHSKFAKLLVDGYKKPELVLERLRNLDLATTLELIRWEGEMLSLPNVEMADAGCMELLAVANAKIVLFRGQSVKVPRGT